MKSRQRSTDCKTNFQLIIPGDSENFVSVSSVAAVAAGAAQLVKMIIRVSDSDSDDRK